MSTSGRKLGVLTGATLCLCYAFILGLSTATLQFRSSLPEFLYVVAMHLVYGLLFFALPSALIGSATGWLVEVAIQRSHSQLSAPRATMLGEGICLTCALVIHFLSWLPDLLKPTFIDLSLSTSYLLYLVVPTLLYIAAGAWMSRILYINLIRQSAWNAVKPSLVKPVLMLVLIAAIWSSVQYWLSA